jgi:uncharacterized membrane protein YbhN (UPF0104 family)
VQWVNRSARLLRYRRAFKLANACLEVKRPDKVTVLKTALAVAAIGYLIYFIDLDQLLATARAADVRWIVGAVALLPASLALEGLVWFFFARQEVPDLRLRAAYGSLFTGYTLGLMTPARLGELAGRAFYLQHPDKWMISAIVFIERLLAMVIGVGVGLAALVYFITTMEPTPETLWWSVAAYGGGAFCLFLGLFTFPRQAFRVVKRLVPSERVVEKLRFVQRLTRRRVGFYGLLASLRYGVYASQFVLLLHAFAPEVDVFAAYLGVALTFYAKFLIPSITLMDLGVREGAAVYFLGTLGFTQAAAFNASLLIFGTNLLLPALVGLPLLFRLRFRTGRSLDSLSTPPEPSAESA